MSYLREAFRQVCQQARECNEQWYVTLWCVTERYGGPEEGGWWTSDYHPEAYEIFPNKELAELAEENIRKLAKELTEDSKRAHGQHCLQSMEWLEARGLDADYLPEPNGPDQFHVTVSQIAPKASCGSTHYE